MLFVDMSTNPRDGAVFCSQTLQLPVSNMAISGRARLRHARRRKTLAGSERGDWWDINLLSEAYGSADG
jgi:hypothetical protein